MSTFLPIQLSVNEAHWRLYTTRKNDAAFKKFEKKVLDRDNHTCRYCGFQSKKFNEIVNIDGNYLNNKLSNLTVACPFCAQCFFLEAIGKSDGTGGILIYLPEISQAHLNAFCHTLFNALVTGTSFKSEAKNIYRSLRLRSQTIEKELGGGFSNPAMYGQMIIDSGLDQQDAKHLLIKDSVRVLPQYKAFIKYIHAWCMESFDTLSI